MRGMCLDSKKSRREIFQWIFTLGIYWGGVSRYAATPLFVAFSPGHSDINSNKTINIRQTHKIYLVG
jgi:hypothetical protein